VASASANQCTGPGGVELDKREVIEARLTSPVELQSMGLTGLLAAYLALRQPPDG